jgi:hypothetical protein
MAASSRPTVERSFKVGDSARLGTIDKLHQIEHQSRGGGHVERTGLKSVREGCVKMPERATD